MKTATLILTIFVLCSFRVTAQPSDYSAKRSLVSARIQALSQITDSLFDSKYDLINGSLYYFNGSDISHPYFLDNNWKPGKIILRGTPFDDVVLKYDIGSDNLICMSQKSLIPVPIVLNMTDISEFTINGHLFKYLVNDGTFAPGMNPGYYEIIYSGKSRMVMKWKKSEEKNRFTLETDFIPESKCYIMFEGQYFQVVNQRAFLGLFKAGKKEIKSFMRTNFLQFSSSDPEPARKVLEFYDKKVTK